MFELRRFAVATFIAFCAFVSTQPNLAMAQNVTVEPAETSTMPDPVAAAPGAPAAAIQPAEPSNQLAPSEATPAAADAPVGLAPSDDLVAAEKKQRSEKTEQWFAPVAVLIGLLGALVGWFCYSKFLADVLRANPIRSPGKHLQASIGAGVSVFGLAGTLSSLATISFSFSLLPLLGIALVHTGSRFSTGYVIGAACFVACLARGALNL